MKTAREILLEAIDLVQQTTESLGAMKAPLEFYSNRLHYEQTVNMELFDKSRVVVDQPEVMRIRASYAETAANRCNSAVLKLEKAKAKLLYLKRRATMSKPKKGGG